MDKDEFYAVLIFLLLLFAGALGLMGLTVVLIAAFWLSERVLQ